RRRRSPRRGPEMAFAGLSRDAIDFLAALAANNERTWFTPRKADYERLLKRPLEELCVALGERFEARGIPLTSDPARSPFRIYRDVRFSRDKTPYKTNISAGFPWAGEGRGPGGYFSFAPGDIVVGGGMWHPEPARLAAWRALVAADPRAVRSALDDPAFVGTFGSVEGDRLKRVPAGFRADDPEADLLRLKDVTFGRRLSDAEALSADLPDTLADAFAAAVPVLRLLAGLTPPPAPGRPG
ncbi:MAG: DUF2461 domain-containing protein, partial [Candidatus Limnocylindrales bacterium]